MSQNRKRLIGVGMLGAIVVVAVILVVLVPSGSRSSNSPSQSFVTPPPASGKGGATTPSASRPLIPADQARRVADILQQMHEKAFNPSAPPLKNSSGVSGGTFINWGANWDGSLDTAADNTNFDTDGQPDAVAGRGPRHDEFTDLLYLRNLLGYRAAHPADHAFDADIDRMTTVVRSEFQAYTFYKCSLYTELRDMESFAPGQGWGTLSDGYAQQVYRRFFDSSRGMIVDPAHGTYRVDYAAECSVALTDAGKRLGDRAMTAAGIATAQHLLRAAVDASTGLLPLQMQVSPGADSVTQAQVKVGDEAQILDALLRIYRLTGDASYLQAVHQAAMTMVSGGLHDGSNGGFFFSIDADGSNLQGTYKETRQAWMLPVFQQLDRLEPGRWSAQVSEMLSVVKDKLWQQASSGYVYRVTPDFHTLSTNGGPGRTKVTESWVTAEAMDIVAQVLEG